MSNIDQQQVATDTITFSPANHDRLVNLCGHCDENLQQIENSLHVEIINRGGTLQISGAQTAIQSAEKILEKLYKETANNHALTPSHINLILKDFQDKLDGHHGTIKTAVIKTPLLIIKPRGYHQAQYVNSILHHAINFGVGPAGTGKTFLAVAAAVAALEQELVQRLILVRPAVEAGEKLGFLPGDLTQKVDPYLRPIYDALYETMGIEKVNRLIEKSIIEIAPLAFMRGRTLNDAFIILDEAQNTSREQMKMFLTRIGFGSTAIITGDITQNDLPKGQRSGLDHSIEVLKEVDEIAFTFFTAKDVVRHPLVQTIVRAYENDSNKHDDK